MKISLNWVKEFTDVRLPVDQLVEKIGAQLGAVEEVINMGERYQGIVIAKVIECIKHPNADKLHVCKIDDSKVVKGVKRDENGYVQVVCGAPNVKAGMMVAWLPPGVVVPSTYDKEQFKLESREIRGEMSNGMLASAQELAISDDHSGIIEIHPLDVKPGADFAKTYKLDDYVIDIENKMFTHRPDLFGILGVAREIAGITHQNFQSPAWYKTTIKFDPLSEGLPLSIKNHAAKLVPRFTAAALHIGHNGPSPLWLQTYLSRVGLRPINTIVDVTNYVMHLSGQPLHAYDYDKLARLSNGSVSLEARTARKGDKLLLLNGKEIIFEESETVLITSHDTPVGIGGVMGGADTEVDETTKKIVLECANFDMYNIRKTAMTYGLFTDAVTRFNKGQSNLQQDKVLAYTAQHISKLTQGSVGSDIIDSHGSLEQPKAIRIAPEFINERLGLNLSAKKISELLEHVEFKVLHTAGKKLGITPPFWRTDIQIEEDLVEEVGRLYGYDHLPLELPMQDITPTPKDSLLTFKSQIREILSKAGANEVLTYSFVHSDLLEKTGQNPEHAFQLNNALSPDLQHYRLSLTPNLLEKIHPNVKAGYDEFALFEIGKTHNKQYIEDSLPKEVEKIAFVVVSSRKETTCGSPYFRAKKYLDQLSQSLGLHVRYEPLDTEPDYQTAKPFDHTRAAHVIDIDSGLIVGIVGEYKRSVAKALKLPVNCAGFELSTVKIQQITSGTSKYISLPRFPRVEQDITLSLPTHLTYGEVTESVRKKLEEYKPENTLAKLNPIDIYQKAGGPIHMTWRLSISSYERTMTDGEVNSLLDKIAAAISDKYDAKRL